MDWKPERAVQAKIRDFKKTQKQKQKNMTTEACRRKNTWCRFTNADFFQTFDRQWAISPRGISCYLVLGFTPSTARFVRDNIISKEVCRVFKLQCRSTSYLTSLVSPRRVHLSHTIYEQSYKLHSYIHTFIHQYFHMFIYAHIHAYTTYTQHQSTHGCISHPKFWSAASFRFNSYLSYFKWLVLTNGQLEFTFYHMLSGQF